jgi:hypothetical protein
LQRRRNFNNVTAEQVAQAPAGGLGPTVPHPPVRRFQSNPFRRGTISTGGGGKIKETKRRAKVESLDRKNSRARYEYRIPNARAKKMYQTRIEFI